MERLLVNSDVLSSVNIAILIIIVIAIHVRLLSIEYLRLVIIMENVKLYCNKRGCI